MDNQITIHELLGDDSNPEYEAFVDKFKPKLTTDDCYTPPIVYDAVAKWTEETYGIDKRNFVRPFFPVVTMKNSHTRKMTWWWTIRRSRSSRRL